MLAALGNARRVPVEVVSALSGEQTLGDGERLAQTLWLMLIFAVEASASASAVTLASTVDGASWQSVVTFRATPAALEDGALPHLLEAFARTQACEPREAGRIAWVLALCRRVAEAHGGSFDQTSGGKRRAGDAHAAHTVCPPHDRRTDCRARRPMSGFSRDDWRSCRL